MKIQTLEEMIELDFFPVPETTRFHAHTQPNHPALIQDGRSISYAELDELMDRVAAALQRDGIKPREAVAICAGTSLEYAVVYMGSLRAGVAVAPLAPSSAPESLIGMMKDAGARKVFLDKSVAAGLGEWLGKLPAEIVSLDGSDIGQPLTQWLAPAGSKPAAVEITPDMPFNLIYSSGTTGAPKGIVQAHAMRWIQVRHSVANEHGPEAVTLLSTPLYSNTTLVSFFPTLGLGGTVVLMARFEAGAYLELAQKHRVTHTMLVPVQYQRIMAHPDFDSYDLSSFRKKFCTSAPFSAALKADIVKRWPGHLIEFYGMTEGGGSFVLEAHNHPDKLHTVGMPFPGHDVRLIDEEGRELPPGATGEVVGHSNAMMAGYHNQPQKTAEAEWFDASGKRFIRTGDIGRFDADGFLTLLDRKKDVVISGGFNVYPSDLEAVVARHEAVAEVAVVGVPSERWGETPVAFVVRKAGAAVGEAEILEWANARLGKTQRLAALEFIDALPRSAIGKVLKRTLREQFKPKNPV